VQRLRQLVELADRYDAQATLRPDDFVALARASAVDDPAPAPVRVMTVHKAKGLEFDAVVLPQLDLLMGKVGGQSVYVVRDEPTGPITAVYCRAAEPVRALSPQLQEGYAHEVARRLQDDLCSLYVAMTRARHGLYMIVPPLRPTKSGEPGKRGWLNTCAASILRRALRPAGFEESFEGNQVLYHHGDPAWPAQLPPIPARALGPATAPAPALPQAAPPTAPPAPAAHARRSWRQVTPSSLESAGLVRVSDLLDLEPTPARVRGSIVHAWFAQIEYLEDAAALPDDRTLEAIARAALDPGTPLDPAGLAALRAQFRGLLAHPTADVRACLGRPKPDDPAWTCELWRERPFAVRLGDRLLSGRFDRVLVFRRGGRPVRARVLDFKTDRLAPGGANLAAIAAAYRPQMQAYRQALAAMLGLAGDRIGAALLLVATGRACEINI
jgi:ATP-dependent exoDNAse (exonuclease V) beta subunit